MKYTNLKRQITAWMLMGLFVVEPAAILAADAPILPDTKAPASQQPLVQQTANGIPLVQITAPTAGGVSRNLYTHFNVPEKGAILNNAHKVTNTQLAGYVQANPNMVRGTAKLIVNEVTGSGRTAMNGFLEVAGDRAGVIVANPNGIAVNGGGFLNTSRAMLTTGRPIYDASGRVTDVTVAGGRIQVAGKGLDASQTDQVDLLAQAIQVNAGIWAKEAHVVTGRNRIAYDGLQVTPLSETGNQNVADEPGVALDVAAIGGMYANRIYLVGTEKGLGVNLGGTLSATDSLALENNGDLHITQTGTAYSDGTLQVHTTGAVTNEQTLASGKDAVIRADQGMTNHAVVGAGISRDGQVNQAGNLTVRTTTLTSDKAQIVSGGNLDIQANQVSVKEGSIAAQGNAAVQVQQTLEMEKGKVSAAGNLTIQADKLPLKGVIASGGDTAITTHQSLQNEDSDASMGTITADGNLTLHTDGTLTNSRKIESGKTLKVEAGQGIQNNATGELNGQDVVQQTTTLDNTGLINGTQHVTVTAKHIINHENGRIYGEDVTLQADRLENRRQAELEEKLAAAMKTLQEKEAALEAAYSADVTKYTSSAQESQYKAAIEQADKAYDAQLAVVQGLLAKLDTHKAGTIAARNTLTVQAQAIENRHNATLYSGGDMHLTADDTLTNQGASIESMGNLTIQAGQIRNENDAFSAKRVGSTWMTNPEKIRIDQAGHAEQGQAFDRSEFSNLSSGYGAYHHPKAMTVYEPVYDTVDAPESGETADPAYKEGTTISNYEWNDPIFQTFGLTPMVSERPAAAGPAQTAWDTQFQALLAELDKKVTTHNQEAEAHNAALGLADSQKINNYTIIRSHSQTSHEEVTSTNAGVIRSGQAMIVKGDVTNENSQLTAGTTLTATGRVDNIAKENQERTVTFGTTQGSYTYKRKWPHKSRRRGYNSEVFMTPQVGLSNTSSLKVAEYADHGTTPAGKDITDTLREQASSFLDPFSLDTRHPSDTTTAWKATAGNLASSLYTLHPETTAKYLVETDPAFTNKHNFLSSDYMYQQLKWDPDKVPKRLGDGFYEQSLIRSQILNQTGRQYLGDYTDDMTQYKALMDAGLAYAKATGLAPGVSLSPEQVAALTSDMVWLETKTVTVDGKEETVIYPKVYLRGHDDLTLTTDGSLISANTLVIQTKEAVRNAGTLFGKTVQIQAGSLDNSGHIQGQKIAMVSENDIHQTGRVTASDRLQMQAKGNITIESTATHLANQDVLDRTAGIAVTRTDGVAIISAGQDLNLAGATLQALGRQGAVLLQAGNDVNLTTLTLAAKKDMTLNQDNYLRTQRQTEAGTVINANGGVSLAAGRDITARSAYMNSDDGTVSLMAGRNLALTAGRSVAVDDYGLKHKEKGLLSSTTTTVRTHDDHETVLGTTVTGKQVHLGAGQDVRLTAATVAGQGDVVVAAGRNLTADTAVQYDQATAYTKVKSSGVLGAGLGVLIGTQQTKDNYEGEWKTQVGSTLASTGGSLTLAAGDTAHLTTADIFGRQGVTLTGQEVLVDGATNEAHEKRTHEESRSGLSLSLSNSAISAGETFRGAVRTAQSRDNKTLQGLELVEAGRNLRKDLKGKSTADVASVGLHVGIGSSSFKQESEVNQQTYAGGRMMSAGDVTVRAESSQENKGNLTAVGESIQGKNVSLTASGAVRLQTGTNEETIRDNYQSHGASIGASFHGGLTSIDASYGKMKDQGTTTRVTHTGSHVTAQDSLMTSSGKDTTLVGSQLQGQSVTVKTGGNLHIESVQDSETYRGNRSSAGISLEAKSGNASYSRGKTTSDYASVTEQAGIYAGDQGYEVDVNKDTQLKGAVIASTADANRNHLTTGTLHLEDIQNKAAYDVKNTGVAYNHYASDQERNQHFNETGLTPDILPGTTKDAHSVTRSAISQGTIQVTQGAMDVTKINRDTAHALQTLDHIFDKQKVEERQELARLFAKNADELLHYYDRDGKFDKALAHGLVAEITSQIAGNKAGSGFAAGMTNELLINKIKEWAGNDPAKAQWISAALGATVNAAAGKNIQTGGATAQYGTKWNVVLVAPLAYESTLLAAGAVITAVSFIGNKAYRIYHNLTDDSYIYVDTSGDGSVTGLTYMDLSGTHVGLDIDSVLPYPNLEDSSPNEETGGADESIPENGNNYNPAPLPPPVTKHLETDPTTGQVIVAYSDGKYEITNDMILNGVKYTMAGIDKFNRIFGISADGQRAYFPNQYNIGGNRTATSTGIRDLYGHLIGTANDTGESVKLNDWIIKNGIHAWYLRDNKLTGEILVTDGMGEYGTGEYRNGAPKSVEIAPMPPNPNNPNPLEIPMPDQSKNQEDYSDDTAYLYSKNFSKATSEYALDLIGKKYYGLPNLGKAVFTGAGSVEDYLEGESLENIVFDNLGSEFFGRTGKASGKIVSHFKKAEINSEFLSSVWTAVWDTNSDKKKKEDEKKQISN